jgi:hypothetical protein
MSFTLASAAPLIGGALSALGRGGGGTKVTQNNQQNTTVSTPVATNTSIAFNPVLAALTGGGVAPSTAGGITGGLTQTPTTTSSPTLTGSPSDALPSSSPTGFAYGPGFGYIQPTAAAAQQQAASQSLLLFLIIGAALWFTMEG